MSETNDDRLRIAYQHHGRHWRRNAYVYPVISRRSGGLSIGINLNPDKACNFDCVYCQVDRNVAPTVRKVDLNVLKAELHQLLALAGDGSLFAEPPFDCLPPEQHVIRDIAFSGDGEPTTYPRFADAVQLAAVARQAFNLTHTRIVVLTDACYLNKPKVAAAIEFLDRHNGEIWAKLDAGTEEYYQKINRPNLPLSHVLENITFAAKIRPIVIQSLWMRVEGEPPPDEEVRAFAARLNDIRAAGGQFKLIQVYTIARDTAESFVGAMDRAELERVAEIVANETRLPIELYPGIS